MTVDIWLFHPKEDRLSDIPKRRLEDGVSVRGWTLQERPVARTRVLGGRPVRAILPRDATALYRRAHRVIVGVLVVDEPVVNPDPSRDPLPDRTIGIPRFLRYKGVTRRVGPAARPDDIDEFLADVERWADEVACDGEDDPRVLPLHVFDPERDLPDLGSVEGQRRFGDAHGHASRRDYRGRIWERAKALHGRDVLTVAGRPLVAGFHWDVQNKRPSTTRLATTSGVWEIRSGAYVNVHPDAHVATRHPKARQIWRDKG